MTAAIRVRVADNEREGLDTADGRWSAVCETHGTLLTCATRTQARDEARWARAANRAEWCEDCGREVVPGREAADRMAAAMEHSQRRHQELYG